MSTELYVGEEMVALRTWGGKERGCVLQMEMTEDEFCDRFANKEVAVFAHAPEDEYNDFPFHTNVELFVAEHMGLVEWKPDWNF